MSENEVNKARLQVQAARVLEKRNIAAYGRELDRNLPTVTREDVRRMVDKEGRVVVIIEKKVFDVTEFIDVHPGGRQTILGRNGEDVTQLYNGETGEHLHSPHARKMLIRYIVGAYAA